MPSKTYDQHRGSSTRDHFCTCLVKRLQLHHTRQDTLTVKATSSPVTRRLSKTEQLLTTAVSSTPFNHSYLASLPSISHHFTTLFSSSTQFCHQIGRGGLFPISSHFIGRPVQSSGRLEFAGTAVVIHPPARIPHLIRTLHSTSLTLPTSLDL